MSQASERILLTLWVGGMWITGYLVAPLLFTVLEDRQLAGMIAGRIFTAMSYVGLGCGAILLFIPLFQHGKAAIRQWRTWLLVAMLLVVAVGEFVLQPIMADLKSAGLVEGSEQAIKFGRIHGLASLLFLFNSIAGLILVITGVYSPARN